MKPLFLGGPLNLKECVPKKRLSNLTTAHHIRVFVAGASGFCTLSLYRYVLCSYIRSSEDLRICGESKLSALFILSEVSDFEQILEHRRSFCLCISFNPE